MKCISVIFDARQKTIMIKTKRKSKIKISKWKVMLVNEDEMNSQKEIKLQGVLFFEATPYHYFFSDSLLPPKQWIKIY